MYVKPIFLHCLSLSKLFTLWCTILFFCQCSISNSEEVFPLPPASAPHLIADICPLTTEHKGRAITTPQGKVSWESTDKLKTFIVPANTEEWTRNMYRYVNSETDCSQNRFSASGDNFPLLNADGEYDWFVMSPYLGKLKLSHRKRAGF